MGEFVDLPACENTINDFTRESTMCIYFTVICILLMFECILRYLFCLVSCVKFLIGQTY